MSTTELADKILATLTAGPLDYAQLLNRVRTSEGAPIGGLAMRDALAVLENDGRVSCSGGFETYRIAR